MALFARRLDYWASAISYSAVIAIAKKKGGSPISYIVYAYEGRFDRFVMRSFFSYDDAKKQVSSRHGDDFFVTNSWLNRVAVGEFYQGTSKGMWLRVPVPRIGGRKRKKKPIQLGDLGMLCRVARNELEAAKSRLAEAEHGLRNDDSRTVIYSEEEPEIEAATIAVAFAEMKVINILCEMEFARSRRTGIPISQKSITRMALRSWV